VSAIYIASRLRNRARCREYARALETIGHTVTSRWLNDTGGDYVAIAKRDLEDIRRASILILVSHVGRNGGCATELGVAIERGMTVYHCAAERGDLVFTHGPEVQWYRTFHEVLEALPVARTRAA
jgi:hypothetical protein